MLNKRKKYRTLSEPSLRESSVGEKALNFTKEEMVKPTYSDEHSQSLIRESLFSANEG